MKYIEKCDSKGKKGAHTNDYISQRVAVVTISLFLDP